MHVWKGEMGVRSCMPASGGVEVHKIYSDSTIRLYKSKLLTQLYSPYWPSMPSSEYVLTSRTETHPPPPQL